MDFVVYIVDNGATIRFVVLMKFIIRRTRLDLKGVSLVPVRTMATRHYRY